MQSPIISFVLTKMNILYIEDNIKIQNNMNKVFELIFHKIFSVTNNKNAIEIINQKHIDIIVSDIKIEDGNSLDFIKQLRENSNFTPIILASSYVEESFLLKAIKFGVYDYIIKPFDIQELQKSLKNCVENQIINNKRFFYLENGFIFDSLEKKLYEKFEEVTLTDYEQRYLKLLFENINCLVSNEQIQNEIYLDDFVSSDTIKTIISRLRKIVGKNYITNYSNLGYRLVNKIDVRA